MLDLDMVPLILGNSYKMIALALLREEKIWKKWLSWYAAGGRVGKLNTNTVSAT